MRINFLKVLIALFLVCCKQKVEQKVFSTDAKLESLFFKAYDLNKSKNTRAKYNDSIEAILKGSKDDFKNRSNYIKLAIRFNDIGQTKKFIFT